MNEAARRSQGNQNKLLSLIVVSEFSFIFYRLILILFFLLKSLTVDWTHTQ